MTRVKRIAFFMTLVMFICSVIAPFSVSAAAPRLNNVQMTAESFLIENGVALVEVSYLGYEGITKNVIVTITLERKTLFWWSEVSNCVIGLNGWMNSGSHIVQLEKTGEYRATINYTIRGSGGEDDVLSVTLYDEY